MRTVNEHYAKAKYIGSLDTLIFFGGAYTFDDEGRFIEHVSSFGERTGREYIEKGLLTKCYYYNKKDTSKLDYWTANEYDKDSRVVQTTSGIYEDGKLRIKINSETKVFIDKSGETRTETYDFFNGKLTATIYSHDSVSGIYKFTTAYRYRHQAANKEGENKAEKTTLRDYYYENAHCTDKVAYTLKGEIEFAKQIKSRFHQEDANGRVQEYGTIDYEGAAGLYFDQHPEDITCLVRGFYPPGLISEILNNNLIGKKKIDVKCIYDDTGLLIEKYDYGTVYKFRYDNQGQMIEQFSWGETRFRRVLFYNNLGLVSKMITIQSNSAKLNGAEEKVEFNYAYTYY